MIFFNENIGNLKLRFSASFCLVQIYVISRSFFNLLRYLLMPIAEIHCSTEILLAFLHYSSNSDNMFTNSYMVLCIY
jgi:hypothetical protein